ncbi:MAG: hypothetical protein MUO51_15220, partial [Woeseiaceae bacterium]|nr:hypothetical protein [Woeseiaceae bacterium]
MTPEFMNTPENEEEESHLPIAAPCRRIRVTAPFGWIKAGWSDIRRAPKQSLSYGLAITLMSYLVSFMALKLGNWV